MAPDPTSCFRGPCCPMLTEFIYVFAAFLTISTLVSLILVCKKKTPLVLVQC